MVSVPRSKGMSSGLLRSIFQFQRMNKVSKLIFWIKSWKQKVGCRGRNAEREKERP